MANSPNFSIRLNPETQSLWQQSAQEDGFEKIGTWIKWLVRNRISQQKEKGESNSNPNG